MTNTQENYPEFKAERMKARNQKMRRYFVDQYRQGKRTDVILNEISQKWVLSPKSLTRILNIRSLKKIALETETTD